MIKPPKQIGGTLLIGWVSTNASSEYVLRLFLFRE